MMRDPSSGGAENKPIEGTDAPWDYLGGLGGIKGVLKGLMAKRGAKGAVKQGADSIPPMPAAGKEMTDAEMEAAKEAWRNAQGRGTVPMKIPGKTPAKNIMEDLPPLQRDPLSQVPYDKADDLVVPPAMKIRSGPGQWPLHDADSAFFRAQAGPPIAPMSRQVSLKDIPQMTRATPPIRASDNGLEQIPGNIQGQTAKEKIIEQLLRMQGSTTP